jgi:hypothetical protein
MEARIETGQEQMEALLDASLETTEACLEKIEENQGKYKPRWKCVQKRWKRRLLGHWRTDQRTSNQPWYPGTH